jgi:type II secretory pathway pseudopilin PulG
MYKKIATLCSIALFAAAVPAVSYAGTVTLTLESTSSGIYPYVFNVKNGSVVTTGVDLSCLNDTRSVTIGETWTVTEIDLAGLVGKVDANQTTATQLDEQAFLDQYYSTSASNHTVKIDGVNLTFDNNDIQKAIWDIQDTGDYSKLSSVEKSLVSDATSFIGSSGDNSTFLAQFDVYIPTSGAGSGEPQQFMRYTPGGTSGGLPPVTPEPSSLALLGTGIVGAAGFLRKRIVAAKS